MMKKKIAIAMSGGVDSSVAAFLLKEQGFSLIGVFMKNWIDKENGKCSYEKDYEDALLVAEKLDIPFYVINFVDEYEKDVFKDFLEKLKQGKTPNPDILCNKNIKFKALLDKVINGFGVDLLATGHYCGIQKNDNDFNLIKGIDCNKDQSYFLYAINKNILNKLIFPLGNLTKGKVRKIAKENDLHVYDKKDSTGICFIGKRNFQQFIGDFIQSKQGVIKDVNNQIVGTHDGFHNYTIGQRKGLKIGGKGEPWFVVDKNIESNSVIVAQGEKNTCLYSEKLVADNLNWLVDIKEFPFKCFSKVRYRQKDQQCVIEKIEDNNVYVFFKIPQRAVTLGQSIVFYLNNICLGGGIIKEII